MITSSDRSDRCPTDRSLRPIQPTVQPTFWMSSKHRANKLTLASSSLVIFHENLPRNRIFSRYFSRLIEKPAAPPPSRSRPSVVRCLEANLLFFNSVSNARFKTYPCHSFPCAAPRRAAIMLEKLPSLQLIETLAERDWPRAMDLIEADVDLLVRSQSRWLLRRFLDRAD